MKKENRDLELPEELVRCKDCEHSEVKPICPDLFFCNRQEIFCSEDWFCAGGRKKDDRA